ncbi:MAG: DsrE family protein [Betaproteobacteria bacterium]|nr:DsrE family protein [Betaproteobacteria bacterium]MDE2358623.1 DsrE family protein [Betaproteobacteria bacterium]
MKKVLLCLLLVVGFSNPAFADEGAISDGVVVQANGNKADLNRALVLASNMHEVLAKAKFEVVVYGPNVHLITSFSDVVPLIQKVQSEGIKVIACGRSLTSEHVSESDLAPGITVVPFGAVHIVNREKEGWQYIKP